MAQYLVSALNAQRLAGEVVLDRVIGPGWTDTPSNLLDHLVHDRHQFTLADTDLRLAARRLGESVWSLIVINPAGAEIAAETLPHWHIDDMRTAPRQRQNWFQRLLDPDAA